MYVLDEYMLYYVFPIIGMKITYCGNQRWKMEADCWGPNFTRKNENLLGTWKGDNFDIKVTPIYD